MRRSPAIAEVYSSRGARLAGVCLLSLALLSSP